VTVLEGKQMGTRSIPRRHVVLSLAPWLVVTSAPSVSLSAANSASGLLPHRDAARRIGWRYLAVAPEERSTTRLRRLLFDGADVDVGPEMLAHLRRLINMKRRHDFSIGNTVILDGWLLARTEARLCALATLA
jgi:hypothetical protein